MTITLNGKRKENFPPQEMLLKQVKSKDCAVSKTSQNHDSSACVRKVDVLVKEPLALRTLEDLSNQPIENKTIHLVEGLQCKGQNKTSHAAVLPENMPQMERAGQRVARAGQNGISLFRLNLTFRLENRIREAAVWPETHYANPNQHLCHARFLAQRFYDLAPEMKSDASSKGAIEFVAYLIAAKAGEDSFGVCSEDVRKFLSAADRKMLSAFRLVRLEKLFLETVGYECLNFDMHLASVKPPIVAWKEAIKKGELPATLSFEKYLLTRSLKNLKRQTSPAAFQNVLQKCHQAMERFLCAQKCGQTFVDREGQAAIRFVDEPVPQIPFYPDAIAPHEDSRLPLEPLFPELQDMLIEDQMPERKGFCIIHKNEHKIDGNPQCHS